MTDYLCQNSLASVLQLYGPLVTAGAIVFSAGIAICVMIYNAGIARRRATVDLVMALRGDEEWNKARKTVITLHEGGAQLTRFALLEHANTQENQCILTLLNINEYIATGIREKAFDEKMYRRLRKSAFVRDWKALETYVAEFRRSRNIQSLFVEFEWLAKRWENHPTKAWWCFWG